MGISPRRRSTWDAVTRSPVVRQAWRFVVVGAASYVFNITLYGLCLAVGLHYLSAAVVAFGIGFALNFLANRLWTFGAGDGHVRGQFLRFSCVAAVMVALDLVALRVVVGELGAPKIAAQAVIILFLAPLSFAGNRLWAFGTASPAAPLRDANP